MKHYFFILSFLFWQALAQANVTMQITPGTARLGQTIQLTLTQNDTLQAHSLPDLTPLKASFTIVGTEHSMSYFVDNGVATAANQWVVVLLPKTSGVLTIPPIKLGDQYSQAGQVHVTQSAPLPENEDQQEATVDNENKPVTLHTEIDQNNPLINQQMIYTVRLATRQSFWFL